jgi:hypothetical protein
LFTTDARLIGAPLDSSVLLYATAATVPTMILFGTLPALRATRLDVKCAGATIARGGTGGMVPGSVDQRGTADEELPARAGCAAGFSNGGLVDDESRSAVDLPNIPM